MKWNRNYSQDCLTFLIRNLGGNNLALFGCHVNFGLIIDDTRGEDKS